MDAIFKALADPSRRQLMDRLYLKQGQTLGELCRDMPMSRQSVSKHLGILERADLVSVVWRGREKYYFLNPVPIAEISDRWIDKFSRGRTDAVLALKRALESGPNAARGQASDSNSTDQENTDEQS